MRETRLIMGMPITIEVVGASARKPIEAAFAYFGNVDQQFSPFKSDSEVSAINSGRVAIAAISEEMHEVLGLAELTKAETDGYFDVIRPDGKLDPSGIVKGWAIRNAARLIAAAGCADYFVEAGGDIQCAGRNEHDERWRIGIRSPFSETEIIKTLQPGDAGVATSGNYVRGQHIYDPHSGSSRLNEIVSLTVVANDIFDADRYATAAFAMGSDGIGFIESVPGLEGYSINRSGVATMTTGFERLVA
jgi:thiamine biosynthesis lipoprotein